MNLKKKKVIFQAKVIFSTTPQPHPFPTSDVCPIIRILSWGIISSFPPPPQDLQEPTICYFQNF